MCGICGRLNFNGQAILPELLHSMTRSMTHRGPDSEGCHIDGRIGLGHRRLSIIDVSQGQQPLSNETDDVWIVFNGEIYNYPELRHFLVQHNHRFRTQTDTEVIVHLYEEKGTD